MRACVPVTCPVCEESAAGQLTRGPDYEYGSLPGTFTMLRCEQCGHGYLDPPPPPEQLSTIYPPTYYTVSTKSPIHFGELIHRAKIRRDVRRILSLARGDAVRSVVDLGCGDAERLAQIGERLGRGVELIGVDLQPDAERSAALEKRGVRLVEANIEGELEALRDGGHDLIITCQTLEHLYDPASALKVIARKVAPGGLLLIETPNIGGIDYHLFKRRYWGAYHIPRHFHLFTTGSLARVVEQAGLSVVRQGFIPSGFLIISVRNALGLNSIEAGRRFGEFVSNKNLFVVGCVGALDLLMIALGRETSNQYLLARKPARGANG